MTVFFMPPPINKLSIHSRIIKTEPVYWKSLLFIQQQGFKEFSQSDKQKLRNSILANQFTQPFYVWQSSDTDIYCLDGYHRIQELHDLEKEGQKIPELLPATFIECQNREEAAKLVLLYSSQYAHVTPGGFESFMKLYNLDEQLMNMQISLPGISSLEPELLPFPDELTAEAKEKPAVMKITFPNAAALEEAKPTLEKVLEEIAEGYIISVSAGEI
jgi:hypothetical protein